MTQNKTNKRLVTLAEHQAFLKDVLATAKKRVVIVSPFISSKAIKADNLSVLVKQAVVRGVEVKVFVDYNLNTIDGEMKLSAKQGIADLVNAGAKVAIASEIHNKTLARDNDVIAEGSFNWLSAVRVKNAENQREERTLVLSGEGVSEMIAQELDRISKVEYAYATPAVSKTRFPEAVKTLIVTAAVLAGVLFFLHGTVKWMTFWAFFIGLAPFVVSAFWRDTHAKPRTIYRGPGAEGVLDETSGVGDDSTWVYGINNADGSYRH
jgi:PLD-like domain